ncbi:MAG TPA: hopanoid biosynthesis-associated protein HpnK [Anaerolineae bacterium]|nr:hopanoid biosynthesis-associated protein HpnK [Anaerolineae bacterium]HOQ97207.1 hopanoid biosynthesis-associated protein HpnK [Anaerolineae bacterium]HPL26433.1 hopanoid biosynthesis-associated protein HpnK [Anaerolineae bacterium]
MANLRLIFNGDDFGHAVSINAAIVRAHEQGLLTSASLMVTGNALSDAVVRARAHPSLAVGLHVAVLGARAAVAPATAPHLVDAHGRLPRDPFLAGVRFFLNPGLRAELRREIAAQFERFLDTGLPLAHVDGHYLMHLHPTIFPILIALAEQYGAPGIRFPRDDLRLTLALSHKHVAGKVTWASLYALLCRLAERRLAQSPVAFTDRVYGLLQTGQMHEAFVAGLVRRISQSVRSAELFFHPCTQPLGRPFGPNPGDLAALLSPHVRQAVRERGAQLISYADLGNGRPCPGLLPS